MLYHADGELWAERGLPNGAFGTMEDILGRQITDPRKEPPYALLVHFDRYDSPDTVQLITRSPHPPLQA